MPANLENSAVATRLEKMGCYSAIEKEWNFVICDNKDGPAAAAKSLQLWPTLCNPTDGSPLGSSVPGILQARILEWVAISFSKGWT